MSTMPLDVALRVLPLVTGVAAAVAGVATASAESRVWGLEAAATADVGATLTTLVAGDGAAFSSWAVR